MQVRHVMEEWKDNLITEVQLTRLDHEYIRTLEVAERAKQEAKRAQQEANRAQKKAKNAQGELYAAFAYNAYIQKKIDEV